MIPFPIVARWRFSDGTTVELGGIVEGDTHFARSLREALSREDVSVPLWQMPDGGLPLDRNDVALMNAWLLHELGRPCDAWMMVHLVEGPKNIPPLPPSPYGDEPRDPNMVY